MRFGFLGPKGGVGSGCEDLTLIKSQLRYLKRAVVTVKRDDWSP